MEAEDLGALPDSTSHHPSLKSPRLYVFDCGTIHIPDTGLFSPKREEVAGDLSVTCFPVAHPRGTLIRDVGVIPDSEWTPTGSMLAYPLLLADGKIRNIMHRSAGSYIVSGG
jgi:hypothetical protein